MTPMTWFGHLSTWALVAAAWVGLSAVTALAFGLIARAGAWKGRREGE